MCDILNFVEPDLMFMTGCDVCNSIHLFPRMKNKSNSVTMKCNICEVINLPTVGELFIRG